VERWPRRLACVGRGGSEGGQVEHQAVVRPPVWWVWEVLRAAAMSGGARTGVSTGDAWMGAHGAVSVLTERKCHAGDRGWIGFGALLSAYMMRMEITNTSVDILDVHGYYKYFRLLD
jgi:hypothetical protein